MTLCSKCLLFYKMKEKRKGKPNLDNACILQKTPDFTFSNRSISSLQRSSRGDRMGLVIFWLMGLSTSLGEPLPEVGLRSFSYMDLMKPDDSPSSMDNSDNGTPIERNRGDREGLMINLRLWFLKLLYF